MASPGSGFWPFGADEGSAAAESPGTGRGAPGGPDGGYWGSEVGGGWGVPGKERRVPGSSPPVPTAVGRVLSCSESLVPSGAEVDRRPGEQAVR